MNNTEKEWNQWKRLRGLTSSPGEDHNHAEGHRQDRVDKRENRAGKGEGREDKATHVVDRVRGPPEDDREDVNDILP